MTEPTELSAAQIETRLFDIPKEKYEAWKRMVEAKQAYLVAKKDYKKRCALIKLDAKVTDSKLTQTDLDAMATRDSEKEYLNMIEKEAFYQGCVGAWQELDDEFTGLRKIGSIRGVYQVGQ